MFKMSFFGTPCIIVPFSIGYHILRQLNMDCILNNIEALLYSLLSKVDILSNKMDRFQDRFSGIESRVVYFEKHLHRLKLSQSQSDSIPRNGQIVYNPHFMYHKQSLHGNVGLPPRPSRPSVPSWRPKLLRRTNTKLSTSLPLSKPHSQPVLQSHRRMNHPSQYRIPTMQMI